MGFEGNYKRNKPMVFGREVLRSLVLQKKEMVHGKSKQMMN